MVGRIERTDFEQHLTSCVPEITELEVLDTDHWVMVRGKITTPKGEKIFCSEFLDELTLDHAVRFADILNTEVLC